jgi:hypothetical protein
MFASGAAQVFGAILEHFGSATGTALIRASLSEAHFQAVSFFVLFAANR